MSFCEIKLDWDMSFAEQREVLQKTVGEEIEVSESCSVVVGRKELLVIESRSSSWMWKVSKKLVEQSGGRSLSLYMTLVLKNSVPHWQLT